MAAGTPVVACDVRYGPREIIRDGVDGFLIADRDIEAAGRAVVRLLIDPTLNLQMSSAAREVVQRFSRAGHDGAWIGLARELHAGKVGPVG